MDNKHTKTLAGLQENYFKNRNEENLIKLVDALLKILPAVYGKVEAEYGLYIPRYKRERINELIQETLFKHYKKETFRINHFFGYLKSTTKHILFNRRYWPEDLEIDRDYNDELINSCQPEYRSIYDSIDRILDDYNLSDELKSVIRNTLYDLIEYQRHYKKVLYRFKQEEKEIFLQILEDLKLELLG